MSPQCPSNDEIFKRVQETPGTLDQQRTLGLEQLKRLQVNQTLSLEREQARLSQKYGATHPRTQKVTARLAYNQNLIPNLDSEIERSKIEVPALDSQTWVVQGRVLDQNYVGIPELTISLTDEQQTWIEALGYVCTDQRGYFVLTYSLPPGQEPTISNSTPLFLTVSDKQGKVLHRETKPLFLRLGQVDYREIILGARDVCGEPPGTEPPPPPDTPPIPTDWVVRGRVIDVTGRPLPGLLVSGFDRDRQYHDHLGAALTNREGNFTINYHHQAFREGTETGPDLYVTVTDVDGNLLYSSMDTIRENASPDETYEIVIDIRPSPTVPKDGSVLLFEQSSADQLRQDTDFNGEEIWKLALDRVRTYLEAANNTDSPASIVLHGYASVAEGNDQDQLALSRRRVEIIGDRFLESLPNIDPGQIKRVPHGGDSTYANVMDNQRVEIELTTVG